MTVTCGWEQPDDQHGFYIFRSNMIIQNVSSYIKPKTSALASLTLRNMEINIRLYITCKETKIRYLSI